MTLTLPTPDAGDTARQRFALELLLQQPVPGPEQLLASRNLLSDALPDVSPDQWRLRADHLDIAIPSQWRDQEWQHLIDQTNTARSACTAMSGCHAAPDADLNAATRHGPDRPNCCCSNRIPRATGAGASINAAMPPEATGQAAGRQRQTSQGSRAIPSPCW